MPRPIDVFVVAPALLCWGFEKLARSAGTRVRIVGSAPQLAEAADNLRRLQVDVLVVDVEVAQAGTLRIAGTHHAVVLLVSGSAPVDVDRWKAEGAHAVVLKSLPPALLMRAIHSVSEAAQSRQSDRVPDQVQVQAAARAEEPLPPEHPERPEQLRISSLTARERQLVFAVVCNSTCSGKVLASRLCISEHTLRNHLSSIYGKLGVQNRLSLHEFAARHNLESDSRLLRH